MQPGLISVMMPAYNAEAYIAEAIQSLLAQHYRQWELVVVNDGSSDATASVVARFSDERIRLVHQQNGGEAAARNTALAHMRGEFVAFLDADDAYLPDHLALSVDYLQRHRRYDGVYTDGYYCNTAGSRLQTLASRRTGPFKGRVFDEVVRASRVFGPPVCVVLRRDPIAQHDLRFDTDITIGPDWDFFVRFTDVAQFGYIDKQTCLYRVHQTNITNRVGLQKRALDLSKCRTKAAKMDSFSDCPIDVRSFVFYDLLINLLSDFPEKQLTITQWPEFLALPAREQSRLLRLMVSKASMRNQLHPYVGEWLQRSRALNPMDTRGALLAMLYRISPQLCGRILRIKSPVQADSAKTSPFADLQINAA